MKKIALCCLKIGISGLIAFTLLTCFCYFWYNVPVHSDTKDGATDYAFEYNKFYSRATEGFAWGKTNNEGYLNTFDYQEGQDIDILVMGSSHMEAYQVAMDESTAAVLGELFPDYTVYNIGVSGHNFIVCSDNFTAAIEKYKPSEYVVLEVSELLFTEERLTQAINETVPHLVSRSDGLIGVLQKNQFLRSVYAQLHKISTNMKSHDTSNQEIKTAGSEELYDELLAKLSTTAAQNGTKLIIVYHPHLQINQDGSVSDITEASLATSFADICERNNISFLNMSDTFISRYEEDHVLPHGFSNTSVGSGHLNKYGHEMIASALYKLIEEEK